MKKITISSVETDADFEPFYAKVPRVDATFSLDECRENFQKLAIKADGELCGCVLFDIKEVESRRIFFVSVMSIDVEKAGGDIGASVYEWLEQTAKEKDCDIFCFDSARKGMIAYARKFGWQAVNIKYAKALK